MAKIIIACLTLALLWFPAAVRADQAGDLLRDMQRSLDQGDELKACQVAKELAAFPDSPAYEKASKILLARGISITSPLKSYSIKRIIALQNALERQRVRSGDLPNAGLREDYEDAWGNPLRVEMISKGGFAYLVRSAGPDGRFLTDDDLAVGQRSDKSPKANEQAGQGRDTGQDTGLEGLPGAEKKPAAAQTRVDPARAYGRKSMIQPQSMGTGGSGGSLSGGGGGRSTSPAREEPAEKEVSLDDLLKQ